MAPLITGVLVVLLFSIWPFRFANAFLCMGVVIGGFVAGHLQAVANSRTIDSVSALRLGGRVGLVATIVLLLVEIASILVNSTSIWLDPIPAFAYATLYGIWDGIVGVANPDGQALEYPGLLGRYMIMLITTVLFGAFGAAIAASTFPGDSELLDREFPELDPKYTGEIQWNQSAEARLVEGPPLVRPAATGTASPMPTVAPIEEPPVRPALERPRATLSAEPPGEREVEGYRLASDPDTA